MQIREKNKWIHVKLPPKLNKKQQQQQKLSIAEIRSSLWSPLLSYFLENYSHHKISSQTCQNGYHQKDHKQLIGEDVEKRESLYTVGGNVNWCSHSSKLYEDFQKSWNYHMGQQFHSWVYFWGKQKHWFKEICIPHCSYHHLL